MDCSEPHLPAILYLVFVSCDVEWSVSVRGSLLVLLLHDLIFWWFDGRFSFQILRHFFPRCWLVSRTGFIIELHTLILIFIAIFQDLNPFETEICFSFLYICCYISGRWSFISYCGDEIFEYVLYSGMISLQRWSVRVEFLVLWQYNIIFTT